jgi:hypothetical protein
MLPRNREGHLGGVAALQIKESLSFDVSTSRGTGAPLAYAARSGTPAAVILALIRFVAHST